MYDRRNYIIIIINQIKEIGMDLPKIDISPKALKTTELYTLHCAKRGHQNLYAKIFYETAINKYDLMESLDYNSQVLEEEYPNIEFSKYVLPILKTYPHNKGILFLIPPYTIKLDEHARKKCGLEEKQVMQIAEDIMKAIYGIISIGYFHRNLRIEHFVLHQNRWKLQSLILNEAVNSQGYQCQYIWSKQHLTPEGYTKQNYTQEELDQKIVWDFGCIIIQLILGHHKLKSFQAMKPFTGQPFTFRKIKAKIGQEFSKELQDILGKMCHHNPKQRMTVKELIESGFFSKEVANIYKTKKPPQSKIFIGGSSSASQSLHFRQFAEKNKIILPDTGQADKNYENNIKHNSDILEEENEGKIQLEKDFRQKLKQITQVEEIPSSFVKPGTLTSKTGQNTSQIDEIEKMADSLNIKIINEFKNFLDKGKILTISDWKLRKAIELEGNHKKAQQLLKLTKYALHFYKCMDLSQLVADINNNTKPHIITADDEQWDSFHGSKEYRALQKLINFRKVESCQILQEIRADILLSNSILEVYTPSFKEFVTKGDPSHAKFSQIKKPYRQIIKKSYDMVSNQYSISKTQQLATIGMYITYCLTIDKLSIIEHIRDNFKFYFLWKNTPQGQLRVPLDSFQEYIENADKETLVENSIYVLSKYYKI